MSSGEDMVIPDEVLEAAARIAWADEPGASLVEFDGLNAEGREELVETARKSAQVIARWARNEALREAAKVAEECYFGGGDIGQFHRWGSKQAAAAIRRRLSGKDENHA